MDTIRLGRTGLTVNKNGFGALPVQRVGMADACALLRRAYESGINYFDTARAYTDSEEKLGNALADVREHIVISTKTAATTVEAFWQDLHTSLSLLKTDLSPKEKLFCMMAYTPKATVQAALGTIPLSMGLSCGSIVLTVAVVSILLTAPFGAICIDTSHNKLLLRDPQRGS